jgi:hypothetical protein
MLCLVYILRAVLCDLISKMRLNDQRTFAQNLAENLNL